MSVLKNIKLKTKVVLLSLGPAFFLAIAFSVVSIAVLYRVAQDEIEQTRSLLMKERSVSLENHVQMAISSVKSIYDASAPGDNEARDRAIQILRKLSYDKQGYFFGYDRHNIRLFWADKEEGIGNSYNDVQDANGVYAIRELNILAHAGKHYLRYNWPVPGSEKPVPKLGYSALFEKWDMMIGTAVNLDDIDTEVANIEQAQYARIKSIITALLVADVILLIVVGLVAGLLGKSIIHPIALIQANLNEIASGDGDLTKRLPITSRDEIGALANAFNLFVGRIHDLVRQIAEATQQLAVHSSSMNEQAHQSERAMDRQRQETDQVATAVHEMSAAAHEIARSAQAAATAAKETDDVGGSARNVVNNGISSIHALIDEVRATSDSLDKLQEDANSIVSVLDVIRSIAEQTNLLALNAAIEAARAGDAGRGFAVVADEVRALASRTQHSTREIQETISKLQSGTGDAVSAMLRSSDKGKVSGVQANEAGKSLDTMTELVASINAMTAQIASAAEEQTAVAEEINQSMTKIAQSADSVAQDTQKGAATARSVADLGNRLGDLIKQFKV
ncbi:methyl-accepting chemotaxis protein [Pseudomonas sp. RC10]|uniref:methyl-accepting chemotaxis protein n=2 Tax=Pseudomonas bambusae TaxID=3139142 RepID=UPI00313A28C8